MIKNHLFIDFCQKKTKTFRQRRNQQSLLHACQGACDCAGGVPSQSVGN
jgi:hypothetical protein